MWRSKEHRLQTASLAVRHTPAARAATSSDANPTLELRILRDLRAWPVFREDRVGLLARELHADDRRRHARKLLRDLAVPFPSQI